MFTRDDVLNAARKVVAEKGENYVYPEAERMPNRACRYAYNGAPSCLVGHVIAALDPDAFNQVAEMEELNGAMAAQDLTFFGALDSDFWDADAAELMHEAQVYQDNGGTWGTALAVAEDRA